MKRRAYLATTTGLLAAVAGCTSDDSSATDETTTQPPTEQATTEQTTEATTEQPTNEPTTEPTDTTQTQEQQSESSSFEVRIQYSGEWQGSISTTGSSRSIDGTGTTTIPLDGDPTTISANAQKNSDNSATVTVQILQDGSVVEESSTSSEYGVAQATYSDFGTGGGDDGNNDGSTESPFTVRIVYEGEWQGSVGSGGSVRSVDGSGSRTIDIEGTPTTISANAQKQDDSSRKLTIQIREDGDVIKESSTTAEYGMAQVTYANY